MKEIERLCSYGFRVLSYDHTGCMESQGDSPNGLAQSLCDLNDCISAIKNDPKLSSLDLSVIGHSWGGFSTLNITAYHPEISHVAVLSGFVSVEMLVNSFFSGLMKGFRKPIMELERASNPKFVNANGIDTLSQTKSKVLLIYSDNDRMVKRSHYDALYNALKDKPNIHFILEKKKWHNPNYTADAVKYLGKYLNKISHNQNRLKTDKQKADFIASFDWNRMTMQDEKVWSRIFDFLKS
jgi:pimeloyl-ACP methyl ester carboxylesterase